MSKDKQEIMTLDEFIMAAGKEVALGKELKYYWNSTISNVVKSRNNFKATLLAIHKAKRLTTKLDTEEGTYQVKEYKIPDIPWVKKVANYSHRLYLSPVGKVDELYIEATTRPLIKSGETEGTVLSPEAFEMALAKIAEYNKDYAKTTEIKKSELCITDLHGIFDKEGKYHVLNRQADRAFAQLMRVTCDELCKYGTECDVLDDDALTRACTIGGEKEGE